MSIFSDTGRWIRKAVEDGEPSLAPLQSAQAAVLQLIDELEALAGEADAAANPVTWLQKVNDWRAKLGDVATQAFANGDEFEQLLARTLQSNLPRVAAFLTLAGVIKVDGIEVNRTARVDWDELEKFLSDPTQLVNEDLWSSLLGDAGLPEDTGRPVAIVLALLIMAPQTIYSLLRGNLNLAPLLADGGRDPGTWTDFRQASQNWIGITLPLPDVTKPDSERVPRSIYDLTSSITPDVAATLAFRGSRGPSAGAGPRRTNFECWLALALKDDYWEYVIGGGWTVRVEPGLTFGFGYDGFGGSGWNASFRQFLSPAETSQWLAGPDDPVTVRLFKQRPAGDPLLRLGPPYDTRLEIDDFEAYLRLRENHPIVEIGVKMTGFRAILANRWFRFFGRTDTLFREGIRLDIHNLELAWIESQGVLFELSGSLETLLVFDKEWGDESLNFKLHSLRISVPFNIGAAGISVPVELRLHVSATIKPVAIVIDGIGGWLGYKSNADPKWIGFIPPNGAGFQIDLDSVSGGGYLDWSGGPTDRFAGLAFLRIHGISVTAYGIYERVGPDGGNRKVSLILVIGVTFSPGIQLGYGFEISGFGGVVGLNRTADTNALRERLTSGAAMSVLFPEDPVRNAPTILGDLGALFPASDGGFVVGPTMQINWMGIAFIEAGLVIVFPGPSKIILLAVLRAEVPGIEKEKPALKFRLDIVGLLDFERRVLEFDATLIDSRLLDIFHFTGDAAFRLSWGDQPYVMLTVGGFHPAFDPAPAIFPDLTRVGMTVGGWFDRMFGNWLRIEGYFAVTNNSFQLGGSIEARLKAGPLQITGFVGADVLIQFQPFYFAVGITVRFRVKVKGMTLAGVKFRGDLTGPGPIVLAGKICVEILFFDICWKGRITIGDDNRAAPALIPSALALLQPELSSRANLEALGADDRHVALTSSEGDDQATAVVSPLGGLVWLQRLMPLETTIERVSGSRLATAERLEVQVDGLGSDSRIEWFSPGQFAELTKSEALNRARFERLQAGRVLGFGLKHGETVDPAFVEVVDIQPLVIRLPQETVILIALVEYTSLLLASIQGRNATAHARFVGAQIQVLPEQWDVSGADGVTLHSGLSETEAHQRTRFGGGLAIPQGDTVALAGV